MSTTTSKIPRIDILDVARGIALLAMASYHFTWDLEFFGYVEQGTTAHGMWKLYARAIASSFLLLAGASLVLAHSRGIRWRGFWTRFAMVAAAALAISIATYFATPDAFIFFGILHQIALGSLLGLAFLRLPPLITLAVAVFLIVSQSFLRSPVFDHPFLWWIGLAPVNPRSNDYVPLFPWFGVVLVGIAMMTSLQSAGLTARMALIRVGAWAKPFRLAGRHSLAVYLLHQPLLIGLVWLFAQVWPAAAPSQSEQFISACEMRCAETQTESFCRPYCGCMLESIERADMLQSMFAGPTNDQLNSRLEQFALSCSQTDGLEAPKL